MPRARQSFQVGFGVVLSFFSLTNPKISWGWGEPGHMVINRAAAQLMKSSAQGFFQANADSLAKLSTTPDLKWKQKATYAEEKALHFFQWDRYGASQLASLFPLRLNAAILKMGQEYLDRNGTAVWRAAQLYKLMRQALQEGDCKRALQMGGVMGHYIGDLSQPMPEEEELFTRVIAVAEKVGCAVTLLSVPTNDPFYVMTRVAYDLKAQELVIGKSEKFSPEVQMEELAVAWGSVTPPDEQAQPLQIRIMWDGKELKEIF